MKQTQKNLLQQRKKLLQYTKKATPAGDGVE